MRFSKVLRQWYLQNRRDLPWRRTKDPYAIWLSEIILQQTRIDQGISYYVKFVETYPTVSALANASEEEVLRLWQGLGYYSRARNLHHSAKYVMRECSGKFPTSYETLLKLKGVGDYTASAIASICYGQACAVVDGNVYRVLARYFGVEIPINTTKGIKTFKKLAEELLDPEYPGDHNQALMEFGARVCLPQRPQCNHCPIAEGCYGRSNNKVDELPVKKGKIAVKKRFFNYIVINTNHGETVLNKRTQGIWKNLYEFPLIETTHEIAEEELVGHPQFLELVGKENFRLRLYNPQTVIHKLSHQHLYTKFWTVSVEQTHMDSVYWESLDKYPVPVLIDKFVKHFNTSEFFSTFG